MDWVHSEGSPWQSLAGELARLLEERRDLVLRVEAIERERTILVARLDVLTDRTTEILDHIARLMPPEGRALGTEPVHLQTVAV